MRKLLPFVLILVILSSGCVIPGTDIEIPGLPEIPWLSTIFGGPVVEKYENDIVIIKSLEAIPAEITAGQETRLNAYIQNLGGETIKEDIKVDLYDYCEGLFKPYVTCPRQREREGTECTIEKLLPKEIKLISWRLRQVGEVKLKTICPLDGMKVSVIYPYSTGSLTTISFISQAELERTLEQRVYRSASSYIVVGQGPIKPYLTVEDKQPIPVYPEAITVVALQIKNEGSGFLKTDSIAKGDINMAIPFEMETTPECEFEYLVRWAVPGVSYAYSIKDDDVKLIQRESPKIFCVLDLSELVEKVTKTTTKHLEVSVDYTYEFTKTVMVTVNPKI